MYLSQIKALAESLSQKQAQDALNSMNYMRVSFHAEPDEYDRIVKDLQRK